MAAPTVPVPASLVDVGDRAAARIDALLAEEAERWARVDPSLAEPLASLRSLVTAGGKRLRPAFCYWGYVGAGGEPTADVIIDACAAVELLHTFALLHDDIIDGSARRRGMTCVHADYTERHRIRQWRGEARRFGEGAAILIGDLAFVYADGLLGPVPTQALDVWNDLRLEVNIGQYLDLVATATGSVTAEKARTICVYKSGKYTVERPLHLGAAIAGGLDRTAPSFTAYGVPLGEAFQLRDDILGALGDEARLGKDVGDDFRQGKPTALYALARQRAEGDDARLLQDRYGQNDLSDDEVAAIQELLVRTGAVEAVEARVAALVAEAHASLAEAPITEEARTELRALASFVAGRDR